MACVYAAASAADLRRHPFAHASASASSSLHHEQRNENKEQSTRPKSSQASCCYLLEAYAASAWPTPGVCSAASAADHRKHPFPDTSACVPSSLNPAQANEDKEQSTCPKSSQATCRCLLEGYSASGWPTPCVGMPLTVPGWFMCVFKRHPKKLVFQFLLPIQLGTVGGENASYMGQICTRGILGT
jgi:hypothetical protein